MKNKSALFFIAAIIAADILLPRAAAAMAGKSFIPIEVRLCVCGIIILVILFSLL